MIAFDVERMTRRMVDAGAPRELALTVSDEVEAAVGGLATREDVQLLRAELHEALHAQTWRLVTFGVALAAVVVAAIAGIVAALV